jgi:signal transduction histidine kinase/DNA-binding response OmpR family regulator
VVAVFASWGLWELKSVMAVRRQASGMQMTLHTMLEDLQDADMIFVLSKPGTQEEDVRKLVTLVTRAHQKAVRLTKIDVLNPQIHKEISELEELIHGKVRTEDDYLISGGVFDEPVTKKVTTMRDNLVLTEVVQSKITKVDRMLQDYLLKHQGYVDRYFTFSLVTISLGVLMSFGLFLLFGNLVSREIDRRSKLETELRRAQEAAIAASALKSQFLATVSHEVRTPLNGIIGMSELIREKAQGEMKKFAGVIHDSGRNLLRIVNDILDFSRIEANRLELELQEVRLSQVIEGAVELFSPRANDKRLVLLADYDLRLESDFAADGARLSQVLHNLIGNAIKFTTTGFVKVEGHVLLQTEGGEFKVRLSVEDTGVGIATEKTGLLFQPFQQASSEHQREGTGLGLSISKRLIEMMGGTIHFTSQLGSGSKFWVDVPVRQLRAGPKHERPDLTVYSFKLARPLSDVLAAYARHLGVRFHSVETLPAMAPSAVLCCDDESVKTLPQEWQKHALVVDFPSASTVPFAWRTLTLPLTFDRFAKALPLEKPRVEKGATPSPSQALVARGNGLILLVEDNATNQILAQTQLEQLGYRVQLAENGAECLEAMKRINYDLILMDCRMPVLDGFETTRRIRERERLRQSGRVPIIAITANALEADRHRCLASGMDDYMTKPFDLKTLEERVAKWCTTDRAPIDWRVVSDLANRTGDHVVRRLLQSFRNTLGTSLEKIETALPLKDWKEISSMAHQLKSSSAAVGAVSLSRLCAQIEDEIEARSETEVSLCEQLLSLGRRVLEELSAQSRYT